MTDPVFEAIVGGQLLDVYVTWKSLAKGRVGPPRSELSPARLRRSLTWTFVVDVIDGGRDFRCGFVGDKVMQFFDRRRSAVALSSLRGIAFFDQAELLFRQCVTARKALVSGPKQTLYAGKEHLERQVLLLPLSEDGVQITGLLGAFATWQLGSNQPRAEPVLAE